METVITNLQALLQVLKKPSIARQLDARLADYVFFPLSNVLQQLESLPLRGQEYTLEAISVLLQSAWRRDINPDLSIQLMILLTFLTDAKAAKEKNRTSSEEVRVWSFTCLELVFQAQAYSADGRNALVALKNVPHIGKTLSVMLESIVRKDADKVLVAALDALEAFCLVWPDPESLGMKFFPGIVSALTKVLNFKPSERRPYPILATALKVYSLLLLRVLSDEQIQKFTKNQASRIDAAWVKGTAEQVKISFSQTLKLRNHTNPDIRKAVGRLALQCVDKSWTSLEGSRDLLIDSLVSVAVTDDSMQGQLRRLLMTRQDITNLVRSSLYQKVSAMPRTMHSTDDLVRRGSLDQVSLTLKFLADQGVDLSLVETILATNLRDSVINVMQTAPKSMVVDTDARLQPSDLVAISNTSSTEFEDVLSVSTRQAHSSMELEQLLADISSQKCAINLAQELVGSIDRTDSNQQVATLWVVLHLLRGIEKEAQQPKLFSDDVNKKDLADLIDEVYDFALGTLSTTKTESQDWRLQALALEAVALQSHQLKEAFGPELVDCLYPIVQLLGSANPLLQRHAQSCLNYVAQQSSHLDVGDMIVKNVDYLVNAVGLRLSTFEISPQAPQVLIMMVRLAGGSLLPYLDDIVDNVFTALELFHGYPKLVDLLFSALEAIVEEGARSPTLLLDGSSTNGDFHVKPTSMADLVDMLRSGSARQAVEELESEQGADDEPKDIGSAMSGAKNGDCSDSDEDDDEPNEAVEHSKDGDKLPTPHAILLNISKLTQHFLTADSLELRIRLLSLLKTAFPALARHEGSFLPLINTLWPVLVPRLHDSEAFVVSGALDVIALLCVHAKSFMTSRINELWPSIRSLYQKHAKHPASASTPKQAQHPGRAMLTIGGPRENTEIQRPSRGNSAIVWPCLAGLLVAITNSVNVDEGRMDEVLAMLVPAAKSQPEILEALNRRNADAVWLAQHRLQKAIGEGPARPISRRGWRFAEPW
jgi:hypothetical protein